MKVMQHVTDAAGDTWGAGVETEATQRERFPTWRHSQRLSEAPAHLPDHRARY